MNLECIHCGEPFEAHQGRGRPRYFDTANCRLEAHRAMQNNPDVKEEYDAKREVIKRLYAEERKSSFSLPGLRKRGMRVLSNTGWSNTNIGRLFGIGDERVRQVLSSTSTDKSRTGGNVDGKGL